MKIPHSDRLDVGYRHAHRHGRLVARAAAELPEHAGAARPHLAVLHQHHSVARAAAH